MRKFNNAAEAYWWVDNHPGLVYVGAFPPWISLTPHLVDPISGDINDDDKKNTEVNWWIEAGKYFDCGGHVTACHDNDLDCGDKTADGAVIRLAELVYAKFGDY